MKKILFPLVACLVMISSCKHDTQIVKIDTKDSLLIYLMAGQSNMAGRGAIELQDTVSNPNILSMDSNNKFVLAKEPLNYYQPALAGLDCGMSFVNNLLPYTRSGTKIGLIQCAIGSTRVEDWLYDSAGGFRLYSNLINRAKAGAQKGVIKGILWHQGESNAEDMSCYHYAANMEALIRNWRLDLNDNNLPVFMAKLATFCNRPYRDEVNAAIDETAHTLSNVYVIETSDLTCKADSVHFDSRSQRIMGERFARVAGQLVR